MKALEITTYQYPFLLEKIQAISEINYNEELGNLDCVLWDMGISWKGKGQYSLYAIFDINEKKCKLSAHSTDSVLYDLGAGEEQYTIVFDRVIDCDSWTIIQDFIEDNFEVEN